MCPNSSQFVMNHWEPLPDEKKCFCLNYGLGSDYQMFTNMMLRPPMHQISNLLEILHSFESWILITTAASQTTHSNQVAIVSQRNKKSQSSFSEEKKEFISQNRGFQLAVKQQPNQVQNQTDVTSDSPLLCLWTQGISRSWSFNARFVIDLATLLTDDTRGIPRATRSIHSPSIVSSKDHWIWIWRLDPWLRCIISYV